MTTGTIRVEEENHVRRVLIDRPNKANALTAAMMHAVAVAVRSGSHADIILVQGQSKRGFSAGADIAEFLQGGEHLKRQEEGLKDIVSAFVGSPRPIIAAIHGRTLGAGVLLAALCDLVIAADNLTFGLPEIRFNMYPVIVHAVIDEKISPALAFQLCATGRLLSATEGRTLGLVSDVVPETNFESEMAGRVEFYQDHAAALTIGRRVARETKPSKVNERIAQLAPLMHENFRQPGVHAKITGYFAGQMERACDAVALQPPPPRKRSSSYYCRRHAILLQPLPADRIQEEAAVPDSIRLRKQWPRLPSRRCGQVRVSERRPS